MSGLLARSLPHTGLGETPANGVLKYLTFYGLRHVLPAMAVIDHHRHLPLIRVLILEIPSDILVPDGHQPQRFAWSPKANTFNVSESSWTRRTSVCSSSWRSSSCSFCQAVLGARCTCCPSSRSAVQADRGLQPLLCVRDVAVLGRRGPLHRHVPDIRDAHKRWHKEKGVRTKVVPTCPTYR